MILTTKSGDVYRINSASKTWVKLEGKCEGSFDHIGRIKIGQPLRIEILTDPIEKVEDHDTTNPA